MDWSFFFLIHRTAMKACMPACVVALVVPVAHKDKTRQHKAYQIIGMLPASFPNSPSPLLFCSFSSSPLLLFSSSPLLLFSSSSLQLWLKLINSNSTMVGHLRTDVINGETASVLTKVSIPLLPFPGSCCILGVLFSLNLHIQRQMYIRKERTNKIKKTWN